MPSFWLVLLLAIPLFADSGPIPLMNQADAAYAQRPDLAQAKIALEIYQKLLVAEPNNVEAHWKATRAAWWLGDHAESRAQKLEQFQRGIDYAKQALTTDPNCVEAHFWLGATYGSFGETKGVMKSLSLIKPIRREMAEVNRINDRYNGGGSYRVLGVMDYKVPGIAGGNKKRALEQLEKSLQIDPNNPFTHYYLAEYYQTIGKTEKMKDEWALLKTLRVAEEFKPEHAMLLAKGQKVFE